MIPRRQLFLLAVTFFLARLVLVLCAADRLSEPDLAEVKLTELGDSWILSGEPPDGAELLRAARAGTNAPHGAYLPASLLYAAIAVPLGEAGNYLALKIVGILFATAGLLVWVLLATELADRRAGGVMALLMFLPPPAFLAGTMVPWGSHPEAVFFLGLAAYAVVKCPVDRGPTPRYLITGALALAAGMNLLVSPMVAVLATGLAWDQRRTLRDWALPALFGCVFLALLSWVSGGPWASVTETTGASPLQLATGSILATSGHFVRSLGELFPLPLGGTNPALWWGPLTVDGAYSIVFLFGTSGALAVAYLRGTHRGRLLALFGGLPVVHLLSLALWAPRRPFIPPRYLLPLLPILLLGLVLAWAESSGQLRRVFARFALLFAVLPGFLIQAQLVDLSRIASFAEYRPAAWLAEDIGHVSYSTAPAVNRFLEGRGAGRTIGFNFAAGAGASDALLSERRPAHILDAAGLLARREDFLSNRSLLAPDAEDEGQRTLLHENIGWGMAVFAPDSLGTWQALLSRLEPSDRTAVARGIGMALAWGGEHECTTMRYFGGPDHEAVEAGFASIRPTDECNRGTQSPKK